MKTNSLTTFCQDRCVRSICVVVHIDISRLSIETHASNDRSPYLFFKARGHLTANSGTEMCWAQKGNKQHFIFRCKEGGCRSTGSIEQRISGSRYS
jgi:hypothetical protein